MKIRWVTGRMISLTAIHLGSGQENEVTDALLRRTIQGNLLLPGTALAGALRTLATRLAPRLGMRPCAALQKAPDPSLPCGCGVCRLFGDLHPTEPEDGRLRAAPRAHASRLFVGHALLEGEARPSIRDGVGIDRTTQAAARAGAVKFDLEVIPAGALFGLRLELRGTTMEDGQLLAAVLAEWVEGRGRIGGRTARGLGSFRLEEVRCVERDWDQAEDLMAFLQSDEPWQGAREVEHWLDQTLTGAQSQVREDAHQEPAMARSFITVAFDLQAKGPLLTNDATVSGWVGFDHAPLLPVIHPDAHPVLSGAGLRGVLRSHAERIARTLWALEEGAKPEAQRDLVSCPACNPVESRVWKDEGRTKPVPLPQCDALLKESGIPSDEEPGPDQLCLACWLFGSPRQGSRLGIEDAPLAEGTRPVYKILDFLAIDRFTGGGSEHRKFDALALWRPRFTARLHLESPEDWELGWLALVLRDLGEGYLSVGFGAAKGFGRIAVPSFRVTVGFLADGDLPMEVRRGAEPTPYSGLYHVLTWDTANTGQQATLRAMAETWVQSFVAKVRGFRRPGELRLRADTYFGTEVEQLYPREVPLNA